MKKLISDRGALVQFIKFSLVGALNSLVHFCIFVVLYRVAAMHYLASSAIGYSFGMINSYVLNRRWTFASTQEAMKKEFGKFVLVNMLALGANIGALRLFKESFDLSAETGQIWAIGLSLLVNFLGNRHWTFKKYEGSSL